jgi:hypothetical protein
MNIPDQTLPARIGAAATDVYRANEPMTFVIYRAACFEFASDRLPDEADQQITGSANMPNLEEWTRANQAIRERIGWFYLHFIRLLGEPASQC